jgi:hypothetical protein
MTRFPRRSFLRGAGGAVLALPVFDFMLNGNGDAFADETPLPTCFGVYFWGCGISDKWYHFDPGPELRFSPDSPLTPFNPLASYCNVARNFTTYATRAEGSDGHWPYSALILTGRQRDRVNKLYHGKTIDYMVRDGLGLSDPIPAVRLSSGMCFLGASGQEKTVSYNGAGVYDTPIWRPIDLFNRLFAGVVVDPESPESHRNRRRKAVLDAVRENASRFRQQLGASDRLRLDAHLENVSSLADRVEGLIAPGSACTVPAAPAGALGPAYPTGNPANAGNAITYYYNLGNDTYDSEPLTALNELYTDLLVAAMTCGAVRVFNYSFSGGSGSGYLGEVPSLRALGPQSNGRRIGSYHDALSHAVQTAGDQTVDNGLATPPTSNQVAEAMRDCNRYIMNMLAVLATKMAATPVGASNLLQQSLLFATSDHGSGNHSPHDFPVLLVGGAGGGIKTPGRVFDGVPASRSAAYEKATDAARGQNTNDILATVLVAMGVQDVDVGEGPADENRATAAHVVAEILA